MHKNTNHFCAQSGGNIRLTVWKWSSESQYPGAFPPVLENVRRAFSPARLTSPGSPRMSLLALHRTIQHTLTLLTPLKLLRSSYSKAMVTMVRFLWIYDCFPSRRGSRLPFSDFRHPLAKCESLPHLKQWLQYSSFFSTQLEHRSSLLLSSPLPILSTSFLLTSPFKASTSNFFLIHYLSRGIQFSRASLNGALTKHKNKDIKTLK